MALLLKGGRVVDPQTGLDEVADIIVRDGRIVEIGQDLEIPKGQTFECAEKIVVPGLVDIHTHLREPGREDEETIESGTRAAAHGGFTAVCPMPNTDPISENGSHIRFIVERAAERGAVRVHPIGSCTMGQGGTALSEIGDMVAEGAVAFSDDGRGIQTAGMMRLVMDYAKTFRTTIISHCEDESLVGKGVVNEGVVSTRLGLAGWPAAAEEIAVARDIHLAELTGCRLHLAHLSTAGSVELVRAAKARGVAVTAEATPHHLFLDEDALDENYRTNLKMNPPLRSATDREALVAGLLDGTIDCIATDHAPHAPHEKEMEFELAPFGTTGLETALSLVITHLVEPGALTWSGLAYIMSVAPRLALDLPPVRFEPGAVADITVIDPEARVEVTKDWFVSKSANSAFLGHKLLGRATDVLVGGRIALRNGKLVD
ncbi:MAG: dihydroorotase [Actinobacteria bacterium HGW-Actinobacteria-9]|nr:MAG: dihydroorotase [Actinobacteria bacterium HGW-Actinobacteria-9]